MKEYKLGFVGAGNMAQAIIKGAIEKNVINADNIYVYDIDIKKQRELENSFAINSSISLEKLCEKCDIILLAVKPNVMNAILNEIKNIEAMKPIVSIAAGWSADRIKGIIGKHCRVLRLMPNTPLMVGEGMSVFESPCNLDDNDKEMIENLFSALGKIEYAPLNLMDAVTAISGSGPAYVFMFIEALSDAGVLCGLPAEQALILASQTMLGASKMVAETQKSPGVLKDAVCSPGGTTIEAVKSLEQSGFREAIIKAVEKCAQKSKDLSV